jgi:hypothetical protein
MSEERKHNRRNFLGATGMAITAALFGALVWVQLAGAEPPGVPPRAAPAPAGAVPPAQSAPGTAAAAPADQPAARIVVDPPMPEPLSRGVVFIRFRTENLQIVPVFGPAATTVSPRIGHLHITVDDAPWHWVHTSDGPLIVADLPPGPHKILIELADANHKVLAKEVVKFEVPRQAP